MCDLPAAWTEAAARHASAHAAHGAADGGGGSGVDTLSAAAYGAARGELDLKGHNHIPAADDANDYSSVTNSSVTITKGTVLGSVYGGGKAGVVNGQVDSMVIAVNNCASEAQYFTERIAQGVKTFVGEDAVVVARIVVGDVTVQGDALVQAFAVVAET